MFVLIAVGALQRRLELIGEDDFSRIWAGSRAIVTGHDPYDPSTWVATAVSFGTQAPDTSVFIYPPWVGLLLAPLALLPLATATIVWLAGSLVVGAAGLRALLRAYHPDRPLAHAIAAATLAFSWVAVLTLIIGQWAFLLIGIEAAILLSPRAGRPARAGVAASGLIIKPQLFLYAAPALALHALWPRGGRAPARAGVRFSVAAIGVTAVVVIGSTALVPSWWPNWLVYVGRQQLGPDSDTIPGLLFALGGPGAPAFAPLVLLPLLLVALQFHPRAEAWLPVWLALSIGAAPYTNSYDQALLIVPIVIASGIASRRSSRAGWIVLGSGAAILVGLTPLMYQIALRRHSETFGVLVSLAVFAVIVVALWPDRRVISS
jgi:hypothetical protein